jgi:hypothetical protein
MEMLMNYGGQEIGRSEFGIALRDKVAYDLCFYSGIGCASKEKALEMLYHAADSIIEQVRGEDKQP